MGVLRESMIRIVSSPYRFPSTSKPKIYQNYQDPKKGENCRKIPKTTLKLQLCTCVVSFPIFSGVGRGGGGGIFFSVILADFRLGGVLEPVRGGSHPKSTTYVRNYCWVATASLQ